MCYEARRRLHFYRPLTLRTWTKQCTPARYRYEEQVGEWSTVLDIDTVSGKESNLVPWIVLTLVTQYVASSPSCMSELVWSAESPGTDATVSRRCCTDRRMLAGNT